ncbi:hypothetical protein ACTU6V_09235 [Microbacterium sp. A204]|uniref:hypothetical protein n=1 Tax=Microbacterium sp. A204 TaxID=3457321 RepID=UPI003FD129FD
MSATVVTFPAGETRGQGVVSSVHADDGDAVVVVDATPFHPVDHTWPDQPGDAGTIRLGDDTVRVAEAVMAAVGDDGTFAIGEDIPVKRGVEGWTWLVGHRLDAAEAPVWLTAGVTVELEVDESRRHALSRGHSACHLASLALDLAVADLWRKDAGADALGNPDFEGRANQSSRIHEDGAVDEYRLGKSLRKAGFDTEAFTATLAEREARINAQLAVWAAAGSASVIETDGPMIIDRRRWRCSLPEGDAVMLCGGTHVSSLAEFDSISVTLELPDPQTLVMTTSVAAAGA